MPEQIVVVAHKDERALGDIAANVTVLSRSELADRLATSIDDVFRYVPGIEDEAAGTRFGSEGINIRGIGGNRVAMVVDGVPLTEQFDVGSFSNATRDFIDAGLVERVEVLHGPASALYGSSAIGGVVAVSTPGPADIGNGEALVSWRGTDGSTHLQAMLAAGSDTLGMIVGGSYRDGRETDSAGAASGVDTRDFERVTGMLKLVADDPFGNSITAGVMHQSAETLSDLESMLAQGRFRTTTALEGDDRYRLSLASLAYRFGDAWVDDGVLRIYAADGDVEQATLDERALAAVPVSIDRFFSFEQDVAGAELNLWRDFRAGQVSHRLGFGIEYRQRDTAEYRDGLQTNLDTGEQTRVLLGEVFPLRDFPLSRTRETGVFVEDTVDFGAVTAIAALRADRYRLSPLNDPMYAEDYPFAAPVSVDETDVSPKLGLVWHAAAALDLYVQYAHGFRAPPYADANIGLDIPVFNYRAIPNPGLRSETSDGFDLGLRWQGSDASLRLSVFHTRYEDFIESKRRIGVDPESGRTLFQSQNLNEARIEGVEAAGHYRFRGAIEGLTIDGAAYVARGENLESGEPLNSVGPAEAVLGLAWLEPGAAREWRVKAKLTDGWTRRDRSAGELFEPPGYTVFDLFVTQRFGERVTLRGAIQNLTDRTYWEWSDVRGLAPDDPVLPYLAEAGRSASLSLSLAW